MNDRELLEMAAKAASFGAPVTGAFCWTESEYPKGSGKRGALWDYTGYGDTAVLWNPLEDDGDALRLATKLNLLIDTCGMCARPLDDSIGWVDGVGDTAEGRVRFAIVKVAAEIGRGMK